MPIRTAPITPEQKADLEGIVRREQEANAQVRRCHAEWHSLTMEILGSYNTEYPPTKEFAHVSADGKTLELLTQAEMFELVQAERSAYRLSGSDSGI